MDNYENEASKFAAQRNKLKNICEAHDLTYTFIKNAYPIKLIIRPVGGVGEQMSMLEAASEDSYISPDAYLLFTMKDGALVYRMSKTFTIEDALFGKIKNIFKNMHSYYLQFFFRDLIESSRLTAIGAKMPDIPEPAGENTPPVVQPPQETAEADKAESDDEAKVLALIDTSGVTQPYVADKLNINLSAATELLDKLESKDLIDFYDGRYYLHKTEE